MKYLVERQLFEISRAMYATGLALGATGLGYELGKKKMKKRSDELEAAKKKGAEEALSKVKKEKL